MSRGNFEGQRGAVGYGQASRNPDEHRNYDRGQRGGEVVLKRIGLGFWRVSKTGERFIALKLAADATERIETEDFISNILLFPKVSRQGNDYFSVVAPGPEDYEAVIELERRPK